MEGDNRYEEWVIAAESRPDNNPYFNPPFLDNNSYCNQNSVTSFYEGNKLNTKVEAEARILESHEFKSSAGGIKFGVAAELGVEISPKSEWSYSGNEFIEGELHYVEELVALPLSNCHRSGNFVISKNEGNYLEAGAEAEARLLESREFKSFGGIKLGAGAGVMIGQKSEWSHSRNELIEGESHCVEKVVALSSSNGDRSGNKLEAKAEAEAEARMLESREFKSSAGVINFGVAAELGVAIGQKSEWSYLGNEFIKGESHRVEEVVALPLSNGDRSGNKFEGKMEAEVEAEAEARILEIREFKSSAGGIKFGVAAESGVAISQKSEWSYSGNEFIEGESHSVEEVVALPPSNGDRSGNCIIFKNEGNKLEAKVEAEAEASILESRKFKSSAGGINFGVAAELGVAISQKSEWSCSRNEFIEGDSHCVDEVVANGDFIISKNEGNKLEDLVTNTITNRLKGENIKTESQSISTESYLRERHSIFAALCEFWVRFTVFIVLGYRFAITSFSSIIAGKQDETPITANVVTIGLARLFSGLIAFFYSLVDLRNDVASHNKYKEALGRKGHFLLYSTFAIFLYLLFGLVAPTTYGFTFRDGDNGNYKLIAVAAAGFASVLILAIAKAYVRGADTFGSYVKSILYNATMVVSASGVVYVAGGFIGIFLEKFGWFDPAQGVTPPASVWAS